MEISNFGRVKSKRRYIEPPTTGGFWKKEIILKPQKRVQVVSDGRRKIYQLSVGVAYEARAYQCSIYRCVYYLFVKKFDLDDRRIKVSLKDEDPFNIRPDNLFLTSTDVYMKKAYRLKRRKLESFGSAARPVSKYDLKGRWLNSYLSVNQAARATKISSSLFCGHSPRPKGWLLVLSGGSATVKSI